MKRSSFLMAFITIASLIAFLAVPIPNAAAQENLERVGAWAYGPSLAVDVDPDRSLVFLSSGGVVLILDGEDPTAPALLNEEIHTVGLVSDLFYDAADQNLYIAGGEGGLEIWDVGDPLDPQHLSTTEVLYFGVETPVRSVEVYQDYAITENSFGYVHSLDVSDPTNPTQVAFNGVMGNPSHEIHVSQKDGQVHATGAQYYARLGIGGDGSLNTTGTRDFDFGSGAVFGTEEIAYVGYAGYVYILDLLEPGFPPWATINTNGVNEIVVRDGLAYVINSESFQVLDVAVPNSPSHLGFLSLPRTPRDLVVSGDYAYVANRIEGLKVIDVSDPANPLEAGGYPDVYSIAWQIEVAGDYAYVANSANGLTVLDVTDLSDPQHVASTGSLAETRDVAHQDGLAYVADWTGGLRIFDVADPAQPDEIGTVGGLNAWRVLVRGSYVYLIDAGVNQRDDLRIFDVADPTAPQEVGSLQFQVDGVMWEMALYGDYLYVAGDDGGVRILDISDPEAPQEIGSYALSSVTDVAVKDEMLVVASFGGFDGGLFLLDITDPENPQPIGSFEEAWWSPFHLDVHGDYVCTSETYSELHLFDISDPASPVRVELYVPAGDIVEITAHDQYLFVSNAEAGVLILENLLYEIPAGVGDDAIAAGTLRLLPSAPNPFVQQTGIRYVLPAPGRVRIEIFDPTGRKVRTLLDQSSEAGAGVVLWDGRDDAGRPVGTGVYLSRLTTEEATRTGRVIRTK
ncbi:MAG: T9SS type A sorting domain-containing protein [Candidatus Eisenbacteria bacterium]|nr:T9SS type A sorting domain-containing protein [Candidatus Latescibacterota bacterium]MBD3303431.1 T9SS type A sorting domain-containing protein [Candidatus Eisenbacteria bacterium]